MQNRVKHARVAANFAAEAAKQATRKDFRRPLRLQSDPCSRVRSVAHLLQE
jgi:hypothetical protein